VTDWKEVGRRIADGRELLGMTQEALCAAAGVRHTSTLSQYESGKSMRDETLSAIADALHVTEAWLRYGVVGMSEADRGMIERDAYRRGYEAAREKVRKALFRIGFTPAADSPMGRFLGLQRKEPP
jgi:transcriptional regulator with XRE-family HTH domain